MPECDPTLLPWLWAWLRTMEGAVIWTLATYTVGAAVLIWIDRR